MDLESALAGDSEAPRGSSPLMSPEAPAPAFTAYLPVGKGCFPAAKMVRMTGGSPSPQVRWGTRMGYAPPLKGGGCGLPKSRRSGGPSRGCRPVLHHGRDGASSPYQGVGGSPPEVGGFCPPGGPGVTPCGYLTPPFESALGVKDTPYNGHLGWLAPKSDLQAYDPVRGV